VPARSPRRAPAVIALAAAVVLVAVGAYLLLGGKDEPAPADAINPFLTAWSRGDDSAAARLTSDPTAALRDLQANRRGLDGAKVDARLLGVSEAKDGGTARARIALTWQVPGIGRFAYRSAAQLRKGEKAWTVVWAPTVVHPALTAQRRLGTTREPARRGDILAGDGQAIVRDRTVYRVGLAHDKVTDERASARALADIVGVDAAPLVRSLRTAGPQQFVEAIALRADDYARLRDRIDAVPGALAVKTEAPLAESRGFARALLGTVGPVTAEQLTKLGGTRGPGDLVGQSGLQARYEPQLGGTAARAVVIRENGVPVRTLLRKGGKPGRDLRTTLSIPAQRAAERALGDRTDEAALVAIQPSTGDILAVADRPADSAYDRALEGLYPPGSTFKVITTDALLRRGLNPDETVDCPRTITVGGRTFKNFEGGAAGAVPFAQDFAQSCNTAFVSLTGRLPAGALGTAARAFGLGEPLKLGMPAAESQVPPGDDLVARAAAMIGQDRILASPLAMAGVAGTLAVGRWHAPRLLSRDARRSGERLPAARLDTLRTLTRRVVTSGTGTALASVPGDVHGKSGTAEFGGGDPPPTHAWFIAYRDDVAIAVLVEHGRSGGAVAAPIAARFFDAL
jgi:cell division protein FtsI/penicillin-binding protein 2